MKESVFFAFADAMRLARTMKVDSYLRAGPLCVLLLCCIAGGSASAGLPPELGFLKQASGPITKDQRLLIVNFGLNNDGWQDIADQLVVSITPSMSSGDLTKPNLIERLRLAQVLSWLATGRHESAGAQSRGRKSEANLAGAISPEQLRAILLDPGLINSLGETVVTEDNLAGVFRVLADLLALDAKGVAEYPALAVAYAVVYDSALPYDWPPVLYGARDRAPIAVGKWCESFAYFMEQAGTKGFAARLRGLKADELKFVVDAPIDPSEFRWAIKNVRSSPDDVGEAFFLIKYDTSRIKRAAGGERAIEWPYPKYTLADIRKFGGICGDQTYFAWMVGKANGVPTIFLTGVGNTGSGHAWVGFLAYKNKWNIGSGRYAEQRYITGTAVDPQTWHNITDHELMLLSNRAKLNPKYVNSSLLLTLAMLLPDKSEEKKMQLVAYATKECPDNYGIWQFKEDRLRSSTDNKIVKAFYLSMAAQFKNTTDIQLHAQKRLIELYRKMGDAASADQLEQAIVARNRNERADVSVATSCGIITDKIASGSCEDAFRLYRKCLQDFKKDLGILVSDLVCPAILAFHKAGAREYTVKALTIACKELTPSRSGGIEDRLERTAVAVGVPIKSQRPDEFGSRALEVDARALKKTGRSE